MAGVPWCEACDRYLTPSTVRPDGTCASCGHPVDPGKLAKATKEADEELPPIPWHLKLLGGAFAIYLGYRCVQLVEWLAHR